MTLVLDFTFEKIVEPAPINELSSILIPGTRVDPEPIEHVFPIKHRALTVDVGEIVV